MRGAILHKVGLDVVKERVMRRHYGIGTSKSFRYGHDPDRLKYVSPDGETMCRDVMNWYTRKVPTTICNCLTSG